MDVSTALDLPSPLPNAEQAAPELSIRDTKAFGQGLTLKKSPLSYLKSFSTDVIAILKQCLPLIPLRPYW